MRSSVALLVAHGKSFGRLSKNMNVSIVKKIFIPYNANSLHWVWIYFNIEKEYSYLIDPMNETNQFYRDLAMVHTVLDVCYYAEEIAKGEWI